jgi:hypothetical protein
VGEDRVAGDIVAGMARQGYDVQLTRYDGRGWRATFYTSGMEHSRRPEGRPAANEVATKVVHATEGPTRTNVGGGRNRPPAIALV